VAGQVAKADLPAFLLGETGVGKDALAFFIHGAGPRSAQPFVRVNCPAIPRELVENQFFGHEPGSYTSAQHPASGLFDAADGGTIFLDEIGELPPEIQAKLLEVVECGEFRRVGGTKLRRVNVRIIAATNRDVGEAVRSGVLRQDLYYRLAGIEIHIPPLRERKNDIPPLAAHFAGELTPQKIVEPAAAEKMRLYDWPGNVRELKNAVRRAAMFSRGGTIDSGAMSLSMERSSRSLSTEEKEPAPLAYRCESEMTFRELNVAYFKALVTKYKGNYSRMAKAADLSRWQIRQKVKQLELVDFAARVRNGEGSGS
jgi:DNA-binding NtrC family response regulator